MRVGWRRGHVNQRLRGRCRRPVLVRGRGVHVVCRVVSRVVRRVMSSGITQKKSAVTRGGGHVMLVVLVHRSMLVRRVMRVPWIRWILVDIAGMLTVPERGWEVPHRHGGDVFFGLVVSQRPLEVFLHLGRGVPSVMSEDDAVRAQVLCRTLAVVRVLRRSDCPYVRRSVVVVGSRGLRGGRRERWPRLRGWSRRRRTRCRSHRTRATRLTLRYATTGPAKFQARSFQGPLVHVQPVVLMRRRGG